MPGEKKELSQRFCERTPGSSFANLDGVLHNALCQTEVLYTLEDLEGLLRGLTGIANIQINLSKMWESAADEELPVANFTPELDQKWPEPDAPSPLPPKVCFLRENSEKP